MTPSRHSVSVKSIVSKVEEAPTDASVATNERVSTTCDALEHKLSVLLL